MFTLETISYAYWEKLFKNNMNSFYLNHVFDKECRKINAVLKTQKKNSFTKSLKVSQWQRKIFSITLLKLKMNITKGAPLL